MPDGVRLGTVSPQFRCNDRSEIIHPASNCLVRNCNPALREQILDVTKAEREPEIEPDRLVNDLRREPKAPASCRRRDNAVVDAGRARLGAVGESRQQIGQLRVAVLRREPLHAVAPAPAARLTDNSERRPANVGWCASADAADLNQFRRRRRTAALLIGLRARLRYPSDRRGAR